MAGKARSVFGQREDGGDRGQEAGTQEGLPGELFRGTDLTVGFKAPDEPELLQTRIKMPKPGEAEKAAAADKPKISRPEPERKRGTAGERKLAELAEQLQEQADDLAVLMSFQLPVTSLYTADQSPKAIAGLLKIAERRPKLLAALEKAADGFDAMTVAKFVGGFAVAFQVDIGRIAPDSFPATVTGVTKIWAEHFAEDAGKDNPNVMKMPEPVHAVPFQAR